jgi:hypothetical protein
MPGPIDKIILPLRPSHVFQGLDCWDGMTILDPADVAAEKPRTRFNIAPTLASRG